ncbi:MAG: alcohol dehydrogenase catalytic domain-containing protein [Pseudomonadales bacterium]|nr:alcohol dehydrogenase catalytic domain-containing protein [Pseudomonadales bacterium]
MSDVRAVVQTGPGELEIQTFPRPVIGEDDALLKIEVCGICGSDYEQYAGEVSVRFPVIPGHEPVGRIDEIGVKAAQRWDLKVGDLVCVQPGLDCGRCACCQTGRRCRVVPGNAYGYTSTDAAPSLWGGYAEYMYLHPATIMHKVDNAVPARLAGLYNAMGSGFAWAQAAPDLRAGQSIAILGPGQRGLASVIAAKETGAGPIIVTGLRADAHKLALAKELGADVTINVEDDDVVAAVRGATNGRGVDVVVDVSAYATQPVLDAMKMVKRGGTIILAGIKGSNRLKEFNSDALIFREITVKGVLGVDYAAFAKAIKVIESGRYPLEKMATHTFSLAEAETAILTLAGEVGEGGICIAIDPHKA